MKTNLFFSATASLLSFVTNVLAATWTSLTPLPDGCNSHTLSYASGYLYNIGGTFNSDGDAEGTNVLCAQVHSDGTIGAWTNTTSLPVAVLNHAGVTADGFLYVLGGYHYTDAIGDVPTNIVYYSKVNTNGSLGSWKTANPLPNNLIFLSASTWNNTIYEIGGIVNLNPPTNAVYSAQIQADGSLSPWVSQPSVPITSANASGIYLHTSVANGYLYVLGGLVDDGSFVWSNVYFTKINADGTLAGWNQTTSLPQGLSFFGAVAAGGQILAMGGENNTSLVNVFYNATVMGDGSLGTWQAGTALPQQLEGFGTAANGSFILISGGASPVQTQSTVYSMALPAPPGPLTLTKSNLVNGTFNLRLTSTQTNTGFGLLASPDLINWTNIGWGFTGTNGLLNFQDTNAANFTRRFYRVYWPLP